MAAVSEQDKHRKSPFKHRIEEQHRFLDLPLFPTTTIGSFPQTVEVRAMRSRFRKGEISKAAYTDYLKKEIEKAVRWQESVGLDVLVHGEFERNDMVEYFGRKIKWVRFHPEWLGSELWKPMREATCHFWRRVTSKFNDCRLDHLCSKPYISSNERHANGTCYHSPMVVCSAMISLVLLPVSR